MAIVREQYRWRTASLLLLTVIIIDQATGIKGPLPNNDGQASAGRKTSVESSSGGRIKLAETPECKSDIRRLCDSSVLSNNFAVLDCLQNDKKIEDADLSSVCHHLIWNYKRNLTLDERFVNAANSMCRKFLQQHEECKPVGARSQMLSCLIDYMENNTDAECRSFLKKMETIIFSDYRLIYKFTDACNSDINKFQCGRIDINSEELHSQGGTIECLSKETEKLSPLCQHEILRIAELQGDDFHLDRPLFFACRDDRERFCSKVNSGEGRVYRCLMRHKEDRDMSDDCKKKLFQREKLTVHNYKVNRGLAKACRNDIKIYRCRDETSEKRDIRLAQILLCLENAVRKGYPVNGECHSEMTMHRRLLMENYQLTPELAAACENDVKQFCGTKHLEPGGKTLHCLMEHAKPSRHDNGRLTTVCRRELENLLKEVDIGEDWRVDPALQESCQLVVNSLCSNIKPGEGRILSCLMDHIDFAQMNEECKERLFEIQYFMARDFKLDPILYKACNEEAVKYCHAKRNWYDDPSNMDPERGPIVLPCLYRYAYHPDKNVRLSLECLYEVKRVMKQRAISVDLHPEIEEPCIQDLPKFCNTNVEKGQEMNCLQKNLDKLSSSCQKAVSNYTAEESEHLELNYPLYHACSTVLSIYCNEFQAQDVDQGDLMQCLIEHKNEPEMKKHQKCRVAVEHFQLLSLKDYHFNFKFKEACKQDVLRLCNNIKTKWQVVACLSEIVTNDTLSDRTQKVSKECRNQLRVELIQRDENIHLDPALDDACKSDQANFCSNKRPGEAQMLECLKEHQKQLSSDCHRLIFNREKEEMFDNSIDYNLITTCKRMIKKYCVTVDSSRVLDCLKLHRNEHMDPQCNKLVLKRMIEQNTDYRLNYRLKQACSHDISKFCTRVLEEHTKHNENEEFEGKIIACLKQWYKKDRLSDSCKSEVIFIIREAAEDYHLNILLMKACATEIRTKCAEETHVEECLKSKFQNKEIDNQECKLEVIRLIEEGKADIQSDPLLYRACFRDLKHYCSDLRPGQGRQLSCLLAILEGETPSSELTHECKSMLSKRVEMFEYAAQVAPAETIEELVRQVASSPARNYFAVVAMGLLGVIFIGGLFCGRVTKRVPFGVKNK